MLGMRDLFQGSPERLFKADAGLVSANYDGTFNDGGFHWSPRTPPPRYHDKSDRQRGRRYRDDVAAEALFTESKTKTRDVSVIQPQLGPDASSLANYVCTRLHQCESAHRLNFHAPVCACVNAAEKCNFCVG